MTKFEYAAALAAAMASLALKQRDAVALGLMDDGVAQYLDPSVKPGQWEDCLRVLSLGPQQPVTALSKSLEQAAALARHRGIVVILSDLVDDSSAVQRGLQQLRHRGHEVVVFHVLDPFERSLDESGRIRVLDLEGSSEMVTDIEGIRGEYLGRIDRWCSELDRLCRNQGVDRLELLTNRAPSDALVDFLVRRTS